MFEKVNPSHPDKIADRIAGAIVDLAYATSENRPKIAVEVLIGHKACHIIAETSITLDEHKVSDIVYRIANIPEIYVDFVQVEQDKHLADNQATQIRCGDNGIFKGVPVTAEQKELSLVSHLLYGVYPTDGKYIINKDKYVICQSNADTDEIKAMIPNAVVNPLGYWTGGVNVDSGATNRKLGSDMADSITGGGLHGKDASKADVSVNIYVWLRAQELHKPIEAYCAIGDESVIVNGYPVAYSTIVSKAEKYIESIGGFEKFAEWGLV